MPQVTDEFVDHAKRLAEATKEGKVEEKQADDKTKEGEQKPVLDTSAEMVADTLIAKGLVPENQKQAAVAQLLDHEQTLQALNKTAQLVGPVTQKVDATPADSMGAPATAEKQAVALDHRGEVMRESDRGLLRDLGFSV